MGKKASFAGKFDLKRASFKGTLEHIAEAAGTSYSSVAHASSSKLFNRKDLRSIVGYIVRTRKKKNLPELG